MTIYKKNRAQRRAEARRDRRLGTTLHRAVSGTPARCGGCNGHFRAVYDVVFATEAGSIFCENCASRYNATHVAVVLGDMALPPWQQEDRDWFAAHPQRWVRIRHTDPAEEPAAHRGHRALCDAANAELVTPQACVEAVWRAARLALPAGPGGSVTMVLRYSKDMRQRIRLDNVPAALSAEAMDSVARQVERLTPPPTEAELAEGEAQANQQIVAQCVSTMRIGLRSLRGGQ